MVTCRANNDIHFDEWWDQTDSTTGLEQWSLVKVLSKLDPVSFADDASRANVERQRARFKAQYRNRDRHMSYSENQILATFKRNGEWNPRDIFSFFSVLELTVFFLLLFFFFFCSSSFVLL